MHLSKSIEKKDNKMRLHIDSDFANKVSEMMNSTLTETVGKKPPIDIELLCRLRFQNLGDAIAEMKKNLHGETEQMNFDIAKWIASKEYLDKTGYRLPPFYQSFAARWLLMPQDGFFRNANRCRHDIFALMDIYSNCAIEDVAYRLVDEFDMSARKYDSGRFDTPRLCSEQPIFNDRLIRPYENQVIEGILNGSEKTATLSVNDNFEIQGWWGGGRKVMLIYFKY